MMLSDKMWFGTEKKMQYVPVPLSTSEYSNVGWSDSATLLNGGGWTRDSWTTHKEFSFNWGMHLRQESQVIKDYRDGIYGEGPFYFVDPMAEWLNLFPSWWAAPVMGCLDAPPLVPGQTPTKLATPDNEMGYPVFSARYTVSGLPNTDPGNSLFIPIPPAAALNIGVHGTATGSAVVQLLARRISGVYERINLTLLSVTSANATNLVLFGSEYTSIRIYVTRTDYVDSTITLSGMVANVSSTLDPSTLLAYPYVRDGDPFIAPGDTSLYPFVLGDIAYVNEPVDPSDSNIAVIDGTLDATDSDILLLDLSAPQIPILSYNTPGRFVGGRGHSGCSFSGAVLEAPVGGRPEMSTIAAKFVETGGWDTESGS